MKEPTNELSYGSNHETNWNVSDESIASDSNESPSENVEHRSVEHFVTTGFEVTPLRRAKRFIKYLLGVKKLHREPLLPHHSPSPPLSPPRRRAPINYIIFDIIWNRIFSNANREMLKNYKWVFFLLSVLIVIAVLIVTNNLEYLNVYLKNLFCYLVNCIRKGTTDCYV